MQDNKIENITPDTGLTDEALYSNYLRTDDQTAFRLLLERHRNEMVLFLNTILHDMDDAEDVMLDAYAVAASGTSKYYAEKASFKTWLFAIGRKLALMKLRKKKPITVSLEETLPDNRNPEEELLKSERDKQLYMTLKKVKPEYSQALTLVYLEGMTIDETAVVMKKNKKQMYKLIERGKAALKELLTETGYFP